MSNRLFVGDVLDAMVDAMVDDMVDACVQRREDKAKKPKPEIELEFDNSVVSKVPTWHPLRKENMVLFELSPKRKTVKDVVDRVKEKCDIPCDMYMKTDEGAVLLPDYPAEKLPSQYRVKLLQQEEGKGYKLAK